MSIIMHSKQVGMFGVVLCLVSGSALAQGYGGPYDFGSAPSQEELAKIDIDVMPDGRGAPPGQGTYAEGKQVYEAKCAACHGADLKGVKGAGEALMGGRGSLASGQPSKTVESYWPYASTLFDFTYRAMPFNAPGSLSPNEVYAVTAYILAEADIIEKDQTVSADNIGSIEMPNRDGFISDPRPDIYNYD